MRLFGYEAEELERKRRAVLSLDLHFGSPPMKRFENLLYLPEHDCLYDLSGRRIAETCRPLGPQADLWSKSPVSVPVPAKGTERFDDPVVYCGTLRSHWGKFLTESISRLWALSETDLPAKAKAFGPKWIPRKIEKPSVKAFLDYTGITAERFVRFERPVVLRDVVVPGPSFVSWGGAFSRHFVLPEQVAERVCGSQPERTDQPVYLSRSRLRVGSRRSVGEETLEQVLRSNDVRVVWPETMSYEEQVRMFNQHSTFVGPIGSVFHSLAYALPDRPIRTVVIEVAYRRHYASYVAVDLLKGVQANYVHIPLRESLKESDRSEPDCARVDVAATIAWLRALSVI